MATFHQMNNIVLANVLFVLLFSCNAINATIGMNWGRSSPTKMVPSMVVDVLLQNNVKEAKIYNDDENVMRAFSGTGIALTITVFNLGAVQDIEGARDWVQKKILGFPNVYVKYVLCATNTIATLRLWKSDLFMAVRGVSNVQQALNEAGYGNRTKAIISNSFTGTLITNITKPSQAEFLDDVKPVMAALMKIFAENDTPFVYEIFPIAFTFAFGLEVNFAFFDNKSTLVVKDGDLVYTNLFDYVHDSFVWAIKKAGAPDNMKIVVGQIGWPTDGFPLATSSLAERYYKGLLPFAVSNRGTPMRPGEPIDIYIHSFTDEKLNPAFISFTRHWGIYRSNGDPKFKIDLSGQGRDIYPVPARGIGLMPGRWCVFNNNTKNMQLVMEQFNYACSKADCTSLSMGGSCSMLTFEQNVSYAFNNYFQSFSQGEFACNFEGLGKIVVDNPSRNGCVYSVEVVKLNSPVTAGAGHGREFHGVPKLLLVLLLAFVLLVSFF